MSSAPQLLGAGDPAYATWTATPHAPTTPQQLAAADSCRASLVDSLTGGDDPTGVTPDRVRRAGVVLSEQRGAFTLVVLGDDGGFDASCITEDGPLLGGSGFGSMGVSRPSTIGPREVLVTSGGSGGSDGNMVSVLFGYVGPDVAGVTVHTPDRGDVRATVANGHLAAWWPGDSQENAGQGPLSTITFTDGTSETRPLAP